MKAGSSISIPRTDMPKFEGAGRVVHAVKISRVHLAPGIAGMGASSATIYPADSAAPFRVGYEFIQDMKPAAGMWIVVDEQDEVMCLEDGDFSAAYALTPPTD